MECRFLRAAIDKTLIEVAAVEAPPTWVLCNHDSPRLVTRLGGGLPGAMKARAMALLTQALPGGIYIYQGEELGLEDAQLSDEVRQDPVFFRTQGIDKGRDGARVPIPWSNNKENFGFTTGKPWLPLPEDWSDKSVASQLAKSESTLNLYRRSLSIRSSHPALKQKRSRNVAAEISWLPTKPGVLAFTREPGFLLIANCNESPISIEVSGELLLSSQPGVTEKDGFITLPAHTTCWINTSH